MADPLDTILRLRRLAREQALLALGEARRQAAASQADLAALQGVMRDELVGAPRDPSHPLAATIPRWAHSARGAIGAAMARVVLAERQALQAREKLRQAEAALEAAEALRGLRRESAKRAAGRRAQHRMDEAAATAFSRAAVPSAARDPCR